MRRNAGAEICGTKRAARGVEGLSFKVNRHKRQTVYKPARVSSARSAARPAREVIHYASHEEWRQSRLRLTVAPFYTRIDGSLVSTHFHSRPSAVRVEVMEVTIL